MITEKYKLSDWRGYKVQVGNGGKSRLELDHKEGNYMQYLRIKVGRFDAFLYHSNQNS